MTKVLAFTGDRNSPGKKDFTGAFLPEALKFVKLYGGVAPVRISLDAKPYVQRNYVLQAIHEAGSAVDLVAFFCHGFTKRIQLGFDKKTAGELARALNEVACDRVALYACSSGSGIGPGGDGGFADTLRDELCKVGITDCRVLAHEVSGHTTMNRRKRFFDGMDSPVGGVGGYDIVPPTSPLWKRWGQRLRDPKDALRFEINFMTVGEIHAALR
jgi:hypothetical protein